MPKKLIQRFSPKPETLKAHPHLKYFGEILQNPNLWHLNRRSAAGAVAIGLFCAWMPIPFQMLLASLLAMFFCVNLPLSVALVWISNPITMPPLFYGAYRLGASILNEPIREFHFELSFHWLAHAIETIAPALLLGSFILGVISAASGYFMLRILWRINIANKWQRRNKK
ncbi:DUF2062 domain-containing protein [Psychromonas sp. psych-6C06]|uniref:DUF2062 domain-containing protein n=1 Tax=Psychromonas sp. psych-6C06 TaxID=2058089 RepID=UPI000C328C65|nr:DUF2062 domain-containing protein [Psychromonas sp. psych-6C06]PKF62586.1 DUF2062 domain-containing protein [Psychromonas sp. psych-6C06]